MAEGDVNHFLVRLLESGRLMAQSRGYTSDLSPPKWAYNGPIRIEGFYPDPEGH